MNPFEYFKARGLPFPFHEGSKTGWRVRSKLAVRLQRGRPIIGLFKPGTHEVEEMLDCPDHHPAINQAAHLVFDWIRSENIAPYEEKEHRGQLRYLQFIVERKTGKVQASFVVTEGRGLQEKLERLVASSPKGFWHSLWVNIHPNRSNTIFSSDWKLVLGEEWLWETIANKPVCFHPGSFGQANLEMFEKLLQHCKLLVPENARAVELYAGIGIIGLSLCDQLRKIDLCETNPESKLCFEERQSRFPEPKVTYHLCSANGMGGYLKGADCTIVDPPRKGLDPATLASITSEDAPDRLIYISCGFASFVRDAALLEKCGFELISAEGFLFFPGTDQVELLTQFTRSRPGCKSHRLSAQN